MTITIKDEELILDKDRAIYLPNQKILAISDLHLGKTAHFRQAGVQVPATLAQEDLTRLSNLINRHQPAILLINGDMFHHDLNTDVDDFEEWKKQYSSITFVLVKGNHDKLDESQYQKLGIEIYDPSFCTSKFCFIHDAVKCEERELYPISGHVHPGVNIVGKAKQRLKFPCFYFGNEHAIMPAFSVFTGLFVVRPKTSEQVFAITPSRVVKV